MSQDTYVHETLGKLTQFRSISLVAVGSNKEFRTGSPAQTLLAAVAELRKKGQVIRAMSEIYRTPCFPAGAGPDFANAVFAMQEQSSPEDTLKLLHEVEAAFGRERNQRWGQRTLDLDLIAVGDQVIPSPQSVQTWMDLPLDRQQAEAPEGLILPHPRMQDRAFVLVPLMDIAPDWVHPITGRSVRQMHDALTKADRDAVKPLVSPVKRA